jgi:hypothetical protein
MRRMLAAAVLGLATLAGISSAQAGDWGHDRYYGGPAYYVEFYPRVYVYPRVYYVPRAYNCCRDRVVTYYPRTCCHPAYAYSAAFYPYPHQHHVKRHHVKRQAAKAKSDLK